MKAKEALVVGENTNKSLSPKIFNYWFKKYKQKFGFPLIIAVKGKNKIEILSEFKKRILNSIDAEFNEAIIQVGKIANLRLNEIDIK